MDAGYAAGLLEARLIAAGAVGLALFLSTSPVPSPGRALPASAGLAASPLGLLPASVTAGRLRPRSGVVRVISGEMPDVAAIEAGAGRSALFMALLAPLLDILQDAAVLRVVGGIGVDGAAGRVALPAARPATR